MDDFGLETSPRRLFYEYEPITVTGSGFPPSINAVIYAIRHDRSILASGMPLVDATDQGPTPATTDFSGRLNPTPIGSITPEGEYNLVVDVDSDGLYFPEVDRLDRTGIGLAVRKVEESYFPQVGDGMVGSIRFQTGFFFHSLLTDTLVRLELFDSAGVPMQVDLQGLGPKSVYEFTLRRGEMRPLSTTGRDPFKVGYARVSAAPGVVGTAVFTRSDARTGIVLYETGIPLASPLKDFTILPPS